MSVDGGGPEVTSGRQNDAIDPSETLGRARRALLVSLPPIDTLV